ncbi:hypothetical protein [Kitasatospora sp. MBT63]|uniref:hypothetical protein n=1 Tax=Kitasatospora sp. MBT63 TaxID=1444768 RepID=UPI000539876F|nr:hypothetical protein [Kitasatospora sp. MBT63]
MTDTDRSDDQAAAGEVVRKPPFTWHGARSAAFSIQRELAGAAKAEPGSDEWTDGLLNASMYHVVPARAAEELRRVAALAEDLARRLEKLSADSDRDDWDSFALEAVDVPAMADATLQFALFTDALLVGAADQERERLSDLVHAACDSAFGAWNADKHPLAETLLGQLLVLLGGKAHTAWDYLHRWLLLAEFTARAIAGEHAAGDVLNAVGLGADLVHRTQVLGVSDQTDDARRHVIAAAEHEQAARRREFVAWAGEALLRKG